MTERPLGKHGTAEAQPTSDEGRVRAEYTLERGQGVRDEKQRGLGAAAREVMIDGLRIEMNNISRTAVLGAAICSGLEIVAAMNAPMHNKYTRQPEKLIAWKSASHTERAAKRGKPNDPTTPPATGKA